MLARTLLERGATVRVLEPSMKPVASLAGLDVEVVRGSILDDKAVRALTADADVVYHLAAKVDLEKDVDGSVHRVNVEGTRNIVDAVLREGSRLVHCSSHHALERHPLDRPLDETKPLALNEPCDYHRSKAVAEKLVLDAARDRGLDAVVTSPGTMIGPHDYEPTLMARSLVELYHGRIPVLLAATSDYVDARDVADGMIAASHKGRKGERYLLCNEVLDIKQITQLWGEITGRPMPRVVLPLSVMWTLLPVIRFASRVAKKPAPLNEGILRASVSNSVVSHEKAKQELGFAPRGTRESLSDMFVFLERQGWLRDGTRLA